MANGPPAADFSLKNVDWTSARSPSAKQSDGFHILVGAFTALAIWSSITLTIQVLFTFQRYRGLYFWSVLVTTWALCGRAVVFLFKYMKPLQNRLILAFYELCRVGMISGFAVVLYSRLRILIQSQRVRRLTLAMIITNGICFHTSIFVVVLVGESQADWSSAILYLERIHIIWFAVQETILSCLCTKAAWDQLQAVVRPNTRTKVITRWIISIQVLVITIDVLIVVFVYVQYFAVKTLIYATAYAVKLELEFAALNQLIAISRLGQAGLVSFPPDDQQSHDPNASTAAPAMSKDGYDIDGQNPYQHGLGNREINE